MQPGDAGEKDKSWPRQRLWMLTKWILGVLLGAVIVLVCLASLWAPMAIWLHLAGSPVSVRGTSVSYHGTHRDKSCGGWVLPPGASVPIELPDGFHELGPVDGAARAQIRRVQIRGASNCADGQYWALHPGDHELWARTPSASAAFGVLFKSILGWAALAFAVRAARKCAGVVRGDPSVWDPSLLQVGHHVRRALAPDAQRAEPRFLRGVIVLLTMAVVLFTALVTFGVAIALSEVGSKTVSFLGAVGPILALIAVGCVIYGCVRGNKWLSRMHRNRIRHRGVALRATVAECREGARPRPRSRRVDRWVVLTVQFSDPERAAPQWLRRAYRFTDSAAGAAAFAGDHERGTEVTVYRGAHRVWYMLDVDDSHLSWPQWW